MENNIKSAIDFGLKHGWNVEIRKPSELAQFMVDYASQFIKHPLIVRREKIKLLSSFADFLVKAGYCDTDIFCEEPFAIDLFAKKIGL